MWGYIVPSWWLPCNSWDYRWICTCAAVLDCAVSGEAGCSFLLEEGQGEAGSQAIHVSLAWADLGSVNRWHLALCRESTTHLLPQVNPYSTISIFQPFSPLWQYWGFGLVWGFFFTCTCL